MENNKEQDVDTNNTGKERKARLEAYTSVNKIISDKMLTLLKEPMHDEKGRASLPFLPNKNGFCSVKAVKSAANGYEYKGLQQLVAKMYLHERNMDNDNILTFKQATSNGTAIKAGEKGFFLPFYNAKENKVEAVRYFAESQTYDKEKLPYIPTNQEKQVTQNQTEKENATDPAIYITNYLRCVQNNTPFKPSFEVAEKFRQNLTAALEQSPANLFKICNEAVKTLSNENKASRELNGQEKDIKGTQMQKQREAIER